jgi:hypothetical protein
MQTPNKTIYQNCIYDLFQFLGIYPRVMNTYIHKIIKMFMAAFSYTKLVSA